MILIKTRRFCFYEPGIYSYSSLIIEHGFFIITAYLTSKFGKYFSFYTSFFTIAINPVLINCYTLHYFTFVTTRDPCIANKVNKRGDVFSTKVSKAVLRAGLSTLAEQHATIQTALLHYSEIKPD